MQVRCREDAGEVQVRYREDEGEVQVRCDSEGGARRSAGKVLKKFREVQGGAEHV